MRSINIDLNVHVNKGLLKFHASRPTLHGLEMHLVSIYKMIREFKPNAVILDPITNLISIGSVSEVKAMLIRLIDFLQAEQITVLFTALSLNNIVNEQTDEGVSSLVDAWLLVRDIEFNGERNRGMYIMKSRGMKHSNRVREFVITDEGLDLVDVYLGPDGVLTGSAREKQMLQEETGRVLRNNALTSKDRQIERKSKMLESKISGLREEFELVRDELNRTYMEDELRRNLTGTDNNSVKKNRGREKELNKRNGK
jgi:circadian clock protein KaiC